jgi:Cu(I)/Ag(I) efflux system membrane fusion protein
MVSFFGTVAMRADGYIEDLFVNATGQPVRAGEPLFRFYSTRKSRWRRST